MHNKTLIVTSLVALALLWTALAYLHTLTNDAGQLRALTFPAATPTTALAGAGWWDALPTPPTLPGMPAPTATPTLKP